MLGQDEKKKKTYLTISHGKVVKGSGESRQYFSYVDGAIQAIYTKDSTFDNGVVKRWYIDMRDGEELYSLCLPYSSGVFKSIILSLSSAPYLTASTSVRIKPYEGANGYTKVVVYVEGVKMDWAIKQLPPQEYIAVGGKQIRDDTKQMAFISSLCNEIAERIKKTPNK